MGDRRSGGGRGWSQGKWTDKGADSISGCLEKEDEKKVADSGESVESTQEGIREREKKKRRPPPTERDVDSCRAGLLWMLTGTEMLFLRTLCPILKPHHPSIFISSRARRGPQHRRGAAADPINLSSPRKRIEVGNPCPGPEPI